LVDKEYLVVQKYGQTTIQPNEPTVADYHHAVLIAEHAKANVVSIINVNYSFIAIEFEFLQLQSMK